MTYGATMFKALKSMGIPTDWEEWTVIAVERDDWKQVGRIGYKAWKKQKDEYTLKCIFKAWRASIPQPQQPARQRQQQQPRQPTRRSGRIASRTGAAAQPAAYEKSHRRQVPREVSRAHRDSTSFIISVSREEQPEPKKAAMDSMGCAGLTGQHHLMLRDRPQAIKSQAQVSGSAESWEQPDDFCRGSSVSLTRPRSDRRQEPCA